MVYKCPNCGADLEYSVEQNKMVCRFCESSFEVSEMEEVRRKAQAMQQSQTKQQSQPIFSHQTQFSGSSETFKDFFGQNYDPSQIGDYNTLLDRKDEKEAKIQARSKATLSMQIMKCTSCGGELAINGVESSTFCAYCGQATVVVDRVEDYLQPDYIIPFKIPKADAERIIRERMNDGFFIPKKFKNFQVEKLRGIYIPFWLMDLHYHDIQYYKYTVKQGKSTVTKYALREAQTDFKKLTTDASLKLNDTSSSRLEPFDMRQLKEFQAEYMSGYYADRFDLGIDEVKPAARSKAAELFDAGVKETVKHSGAKLVSKKPRVDFKDAQYAMLPAWFLTFKQDHQQYTILVNGQTGKMVGAFPFDKAKAIGVFAVLAFVFSLIMVPIGVTLTNYMALDVGFDDRITYFYFVIVSIVDGFLWTSAVKLYMRMKRSISLTRDSDINEFVKERQSRS